MHILCILLHTHTHTHTHTHIYIYIYTWEGMLRYTHTYMHIKTEREEKSRGRNLLTLSSTERKFEFISNLAIVQNNDSVMCEYCKHIAKVSQP